MKPLAGVGQGAVEGSISAELDAARQVRLLQSAQSGAALVHGLTTLSG